MARINCIIMRNNHHMQQICENRERAKMAQTINKKMFCAFLAKAHRNTYAAPAQIKAKYKCQTPILPGHKDFNFVDGEWEYHDSYAGANWAPGREVVFFRGTPVWAMSYQGRHDESLSDTFFGKQVFPFLQSALCAVTIDCPFRGKDGFATGDFVYRFVMDGDWQYFTACESISYKGKEIFFQNVMGELIK